ncbi:MAG: hypothetical protein CENE_03561 [Candidatus Celerinatantimonas neptuna]|nr:MAG: hypothetical protein CENE_03561 [Candidatus Celerinatantimonas neptuna]
MKIKHQKGVAAIAFVIIFPIFFGFFALTIEGTRYLTDSARLSDVVESASLAVAASVDHSSTTEETLVQNYIHATEPNATVDSTDINVITRSCEQVYGSKCGIAGVYDKNGLNFNEYRVTVSSQFSSWFPKNTVRIGFDKNQTLVNTAVARKYQQNFVDIAFVTDMSGSMLDDFGGQQKAKYAGVIDILTDIMNVLTKYNNLSKNNSVDGSSYKTNHVAVVPYNDVNKEISGTTLSYYNYRYGESVVRGPLLAQKLSPVFSMNELNNDNKNMHQHYPDGVHTLGSAIPDKQDIQKYLGWTLGSYHDSRWGIYYSWDYDDWYPNSYSGISSAQQQRNGKIENYIGCSNYNSSGWSQECSYTGYFYNIGLTDNFPSVESQIDNFFPSGATSSSQGIIPAAEMLLNKSTDNKSNLIIVLSDGQDTDGGLSQYYYNNGLCQYLRRQFTSKNQSLKIAVIGFDYDTSQNPGLAECADSGNIFNAEDYNAIYSKILDLITEEIGHLYYNDYKVTTN